MSGIPLVVGLIITLVLYLIAKSNKEYIRQVQELDKKEYPLRDLMPIGFLIADRVGLVKFKSQNEALYSKMVSMYGIEVEEKFRSHISYKIILSLLFLDGVYLLVAASGGKINIICVLLGPVAAVIAYILADSLQEQNFEKRSKEIRYNFPEFLVKLILLINAGLTLDRAWGLILKDEDKSGKKSFLINELSKTYNDMQGNIPKSKCLNDLSKRCKIQEISKFTSIVLQNLNKGSDNMVIMLEELSAECWNQRKQMARQKGEEASTKLLFPMMLMLISLFLVIMVPVLQSFG